MKRLLSLCLCVCLLLTACSTNRASLIKEEEKPSSSQVTLLPPASSQPEVAPGESPLPEEQPLEESSSQIPPKASSSSEPALQPTGNQKPVVEQGVTPPVQEKAEEILAPTVPKAPQAPVTSAVSEAPKAPVTVTPAPEQKQEQEERRGVWISYLDFNTLLKGKNESQFTQNIAKAFDNVADMGLNTVYVQVRSFGDALYPSEIFPWSHTITGTEGKNPGFDPLAIMIKQARARNLRIEGWVNPYRVRAAGGNPLAQSNPAAQWLEKGNQAAIAYKNGIYYNPGSEDARRLIIKGVEELVRDYDLDGIQFDDYFYPTTDAAFDADTYQAYQKAGGKLSLGDWRRENVNELVSGVYSAIKKIDSKVEFGISPQGNNKNNYDTMFIDVKKWLSTPGYVDYILPQIYFGFDNAGYPYTQTVQMWNEMITTPGVKLYVGIAPYKLGTEDTWAGAGKNEWQNTTDIVKRMVIAARKSSHVGGFALFRYDSIFAPAAGVRQQVQTEMEQLSDILR